MRQSGRVRSLERFFDSRMRTAVLAYASGDLLVSFAGAAALADDPSAPPVTRALGMDHWAWCALCLAEAGEYADPPPPPPARGTPPAHRGPRPAPDPLTGGLAAVSWTAAAPDLSTVDGSAGRG